MSEVKYANPVLVKITEKSSGQVIQSFNADRITYNEGINEFYCNGRLSHTMNARICYYTVYPKEQL